MNVIRNHTLTVLGVLFSGIGILMVGVFIYLTATTRTFLATAERAQGTVTEMITTFNNDGDRMYRPRVVFSVPDGTMIEFVPKTSSNPPAYKTGDTVTMLYSPTDPYDARIDSFADLWLGSLVSGILGPVFTIIGIGIGIMAYLKARTRSWLKQHGQRITADFSEIVTANVRVNGRAGLQIVATWKNPANGEPVSFKSDVIWNNPGDTLTGKPIPVLIDPSNPKRYWVDLTGIPGLV